MADLNRSLVQNENAAEFLDTMSLPSVIRAHTGDPDHFKSKPQVYNRMMKCQKSLIDGVDTIRRLTKDETKTTPVKHEAAQRVARNVEADLTDTMNQMNGEADLEGERSMEIVRETFQTDPNKAFIDSKLHDWIREQAVKSDGIAAIRNAAISDKDVATVLFGSKPFLLGLIPSPVDHDACAHLRRPMDMMRHG